MRDPIDRVEVTRHESLSIWLHDYVPDMGIVIRGATQTADTGIDPPIRIGQSDLAPKLTSESRKIAADKNLSVAWPEGQGEGLLRGRAGARGAEGGIPGAVSVKPDQ